VAAGGGWRLPCAAAAHIVRPIVGIKNDRPNTVPLQFSRLRIVVVDDNDFMRRLYRQLLQAIGFRPANIKEAIDGRTAIEHLTEYNCDLAICDLNMKPMNGKKFTHYIRTDLKSPDPYLPIIICTGHTEMVHIANARDAGANEILSKPVTAAALYARLQAVIESPRPFIITQDFVGPDRRRRAVPFDGPERRSGVLEI
jgi:two-component system chemotaxis response regulator CheY